MLAVARELVFIYWEVWRRFHATGTAQIDCFSSGKSDWNLSFVPRFVVSNFADAGVAELADALDSKSSDRKIVWVRAPPPATLLYSTPNIRRSTAINLSFGLIWKETLPDQFVGITSFALRILFPHVFECGQRAILPRI
jgi:hypothetical protein